MALETGNKNNSCPHCKYLKQLFSRSRTSSASTSDFIESPGKKYPRLLVLLLALCIFCFISWLPFLAEKNKGKSFLNAFIGHLIYGYGLLNVKANTFIMKFHTITPNI